MRDVAWNDVETMPELNGDVQSVLAAVYSLRNAWKTAVSTDNRAFKEARRRSLRRHAIETGIIEHLYDIDWGVTEALVAEGLTADAVSRVPDGSVSEDVLAIVRSQYRALEFMADAARDGRDVSISMIKELHFALTRNQPTYKARNPAGLIFDATLHHGQWKTEPNHVIRSDGPILEYTPPAHVAPQMERLVELYHGYTDQDPVVRATWLHHRFVRIHPFEDGNGRVARCLTLLVLLKHDMAPLVVDRRLRSRYLECLDTANDGDLRSLIRFFAELEIVALRSELERPLEIETAGQGALAVLDNSIERLRDLRNASGASERRAKVAVLANAIQVHINEWLSDMADKIGTRLRDGVDGQASARVKSAAPPDEDAKYWRRQVIAAARSVDFFSNLQDGVWWSRLQVSALGQRLRYLVFVQKVGGGETGVVAMTIFAETLSANADEDARFEAESAVVSTPTETATWTYQDDPGCQWENVDAILDTTLAAAIGHFSVGLG